MATEDPHQPSIAVRSTQPLVGVFVEDDSDLVRYFVDDRAAPQPQPSADARAALSVIGAWSDMDWDELADSLDRIRHANPPTPPLDIDL
jgi:hypothetical protein